MSHTGHFSILRWTSDATRDEARNVAVVLVSDDEASSTIRSAPLSTISPRLRDQGILDKWLLGLEQQCISGEFGLKALEGLQASMHHSLYLTTPKPTALIDPDSTVAALYRAFVAPRPGGGGKIVTKGKLLDKIVADARKRGVALRRGEYVGDVLFDAIADTGAPIAVECLSFATQAQTWANVEHDAGHFLFGIKRTGLRGMVVIQPSEDHSHDSALVAQQRVERWCADENISVVSPGDAPSELQLATAH